MATMTPHVIARQLAGLFSISATLLFGIVLLSSQHDIWEAGLACASLAIASNFILQCTLSRMVPITIRRKSSLLANLAACIGLARPGASLWTVSSHDAERDKQRAFLIVTALSFDLPALFMSIGYFLHYWAAAQFRFAVPQRSDALAVAGILVVFASLLLVDTAVTLKFAKTPRAEPSGGALQKAANPFDSFKPAPWGRASGPLGLTIHSFEGSMEERLYQLDQERARQLVMRSFAAPNRFSRMASELGAPIVALVPDPARPTLLSSVTIVEGPQPLAGWQAAPAPTAAESSRGEGGGLGTAPSLGVPRLRMGAVDPAVPVITVGVKPLDVTPGWSEWDGVLRHTRESLALRLAGTNAQWPPRGTIAQRSVTDDGAVLVSMALDDFEEAAAAAQVSPLAQQQLVRVPEERARRARDSPAQEGGVPDSESESDDDKVDDARPSVATARHHEHASAAAIHAAPAIVTSNQRFAEVVTGFSEVATNRSLAEGVEMGRGQRRANSVGVSAYRLGATTWLSNRAMRQSAFPVSSAAAPKPAPGPAVTAGFAGGAAGPGEPARRPALAVERLDPMSDYEQSPHAATPAGNPAHQSALSSPALVNPAMMLASPHSAAAGAGAAGAVGGPARIAPTVLSTLMARAHTSGGGVARSAFQRPAPGVPRVIFSGSVERRRAANAEFRAAVFRGVPPPSLLQDALLRNARAQAPAQPASSASSPRYRAPAQGSAS